MIYGGISISRDEGEFRINSIYNSSIEKQVRYSTSTNFNNSSDTKDDLADKGQTGLNTGKGKRTAAKLSTKRIRSIYNL